MAWPRKGSMVFLSGIVGWNAQGEFASHDFVAQVRQALQNIVEILGEANANRSTSRG